MSATRFIFHSFLVMVLVAVPVASVAQEQAGGAVAMVEQAEGAKTAGDEVEAVRLFSAALASGKLDADGKLRAHYGRAGVRAHRAEIGPAIQDYSAAIALKPDLGTAFSLRGYLRALQGQFQLAQRDHDRALELAAGQTWEGYRPWATAHLAELQRRQKKLDAALASCRSAVAMPGASPSVRFRLALVLLDMGKRDEARAEFEAFENQMKETGASYNGFWPDELASMRRLRSL